ncbi:hypothetical protein E2A64_10415 [Pseudohoeflea suaedae]|uniref:Uncharacterized protein n=1 Tax=Pseudohoeflea suaedae TaxID=877384 RepID=A0A4R5PJB2_9HYPH|nr:hypothetical protein [Pseudohoeflea suaedae]TDH35739.1 hypothetical protein E2A64_10415 [Pseudohoeflea suaedae]
MIWSIKNRWKRAAVAWLLLPVFALLYLVLIAQLSAGAMLAVAADIKESDGESFKEYLRALTARLE